MYTRVTIDNFRGLRHLELRDLRRVNLLTGPNNIGKTSVLEALFVHAGGGAATSLATTTEGMRGAKTLSIDMRQGGASPWDSQFYNFNTFYPIFIETVSDTQEMRSVRLYQPDETSTLTPTLSGLGASVSAGGTVLPRTVITDVVEGTQKTTYRVVVDQLGLRIDPPVPVPTTLAALQTSGPLDHTQLAQQFTHLVETGTKEAVIEALRPIDERLKNLELLLYGGSPMIHAHLAGIQRPLPLHIVGEGTGKILQSLINISFAVHGIVCIDELENGIYFENLKHVWTILSSFAKENDTQLFVTTHSQECLVAALEALEGTGDLTLTRLVRNPSQDVEGFRYTEDALRGALSIGLGVR